MHVLFSSEVIMRSMQTRMYDDGGKSLVLQQSSAQHRELENELGAQTFCKMLSDVAATADVQKHNEKPTLWQVN